MKRYEHKVVLITGAGDIAGATARRLLSEGGKVALTDFSREALDGLGDDVMTFAKAEGLTAHANSVKVRFEGR